MGWIKIGPDTIPGTEVLAISMVKGPCYKEYLIGWIGKDTLSKTGYICENEGEILFDVTHWMYKPQPPVEDWIRRGYDTKTICKADDVIRI